MCGGLVRPFGATARLAFGFGYYVYHTAERKGWFLKKSTYQTCVGQWCGFEGWGPGEADEF